MSKFFYKGSRVNMQDNRGTGYTSKKVVRVGTETSPAKVSVQTEEREEELLALAKTHNIVVDIVVSDEEPEDTSQLDALLNTAKTQVNEKLPSRNDPCLCDSGKKYKKCCGA
ncbi:SEC-C metal-binding domain-containing protein [Kistimonas scapharcae]|uniref:SEC-C metal-binding domain-containing protein n=1 Tax=Kistimonas scapharcae TaxID=1036133 RepID=A0ABP8UZ63_9GAMM